MRIFEGPGLWVIILLILLLFGAPKLPGLAKSLGQSLKIFKKEVSDSKKGEESTDGSETKDSSDDIKKG